MSSSVEWKKVGYLKEDWKVHDSPYLFELILPEPLASWDVFDYWEKERTLHMRDNLKKDEVLWDIGAEHVWLSVIYAQFVGAENMVLIEPTPEFWPNIRETWQKNSLNNPLYCFDGLLGNKANDHKPYNRSHYETTGDTKDLYWPDSAYGEMIDKNKYNYLHEKNDNIPVYTIDKFIEDGKESLKWAKLNQKPTLAPDALTIDVEGAELLVLKGAKNTLKEYKPKLWVSIHDDLGKRDYNVKPGEVIKYLNKLGYKEEHLATDHEAHWYFS